MDWKTFAIDDLKNYEAQKNSLTSIPLEIARLAMDCTRIKSGMGSSSPVRGGSNGGNDALLSNIVRREKLSNSLEQANITVQRVEDGLSVLTDEQRKILDAFYIHPRHDAVDILREELGITDNRTIHKRRYEALHKFTVALYFDD